MISKTDGGMQRRVLKYRRFFIVIDKEVNECAKKVIAYFKEQDDLEDNKFFRGGVEQFQKSFLKDVRREKIKNLKNES